MNDKFWLAISAMNDIRTSLHPRMSLDINITFGYIHPDDPWVSACLGCTDLEDIREIAAEFFMADIRSGYYDLHAPDPIASP